MSQSGELWRAEHVASGVDPASAKERSDRMIAFFRGEIPPDMAHPGREADACLRSSLRSGAPAHPRTARSRGDGLGGSGRGDRGRVRDHAGGGIAASQSAAGEWLSRVQRTRRGDFILWMPRDSRRCSSGWGNSGAFGRRSLTVLATEIARGKRSDAARQWRAEGRAGLARPTRLKDYILGQSARSSRLSIWCYCFWAIRRSRAPLRYLGIEVNDALPIAEQVEVLKAEGADALHLNPTSRMRQHLTFVLSIAKVAIAILESRRSCLCDSLQDVGRPQLSSGQGWS